MAPTTHGSGGIWGFVGAALLSGLYACGGREGPVAGDAGDAGEGIDPGAAGGSDSGADEGALDGADSGWTPAFDFGGGEGSPSDEECAAVDEAAELVPLPADIIIVVDNSGSMGFEAGQIREHLNAFSAQIIDSGIDVHVVLISSYPGHDHGICIDPPLGSGGCPGADTNPPTFTHVDQVISSHNAWQRVISTHPQWAGAMREDAVKHIVVVTDDRSNMDDAEFDAQFRALDPSYEGYVHHSVVCHSNCQSAAGIGTHYINLSGMTGGVAADLCDQDFQAVFDVLTTEVIGGSALSCEFAIPEPPEGMEFDPGAVNLEFDDGLGGVLPVGYVESAAACAGVVDGWHYDDPDAPTLIVVCPQTCARMQDALDGEVTIQFGCGTVPAG